MNYMTDKLKAYQIELPFHEQSKRIDDHYTSLIFPVLKEDFENCNLRESIIDRYTRRLDFTIKMIERDFNLKISTGELMSVLLQHPFFQSRWFSPSYCRDFDDSPRAFKDLFAGAIQNGIKPKWTGKLNVEAYVDLSISKGVFNTTREFKIFIERDLLPNPELVNCALAECIIGLPELQRIETEKETSATLETVNFLDAFKEFLRDKHSTGVPVISKSLMSIANNLTVKDNEVVIKTNEPEAIAMFINSLGNTCNEYVKEVTSQNAVRGSIY